GSLWYRVIQAIHGPSIESHVSQTSSNWCSILRELEVLKSKGFNFLSNCSNRIRDGSQTRFWQDRWLAGTVLRDSFPHIFALELDKDVSVASKMREDMVGSFRRNVRDGVERHQFSELLFMLESMSLSSAQDRWCCDLSGDGRLDEILKLLLFHLHAIQRNLQYWSANAQDLDPTYNVVQFKLYETKPLHPNGGLVKFELDLTAKKNPTQNISQDMCPYFFKCKMEYFATMGWTRKRIWYAWTGNEKLGVSVGQSKLVFFKFGFHTCSGINLIDPRPDINGNQ
nr:RNA-directed DNA polymerase, eukaryota, reverse transcriptase zinc-binding domain protein [Tanacetum cinerariifolium]